jgi:hypothetical protein
VTLNCYCTGTGRAQSVKRRATCCTSGARFPGEDRPSLGPTQPPIYWLPGEIREGREAEHSCPSGAEVKIVGAIPSLPHTSSWCDAHLFEHMDIFTFNV